MLQIKTSSNPAIDSAKRNIDIISKQLFRNVKVTWLLAGGSAIKVYKEMDELLNLDLDFSNLSISLGDERYSKDKKHKDATWPIFKELTLFKGLHKQGAKIFEILSGSTLDNDAMRFENFLRDRLRESNFILSNQGIGTDCHTAGIIPTNNKNLFVEVYPDNRLAVGHKHGGQHPERITITPGLIKKANKITVFMVGEDKKAVLQKLSRYKELETMQGLTYKYPALLTSLMSAEVFTDQEVN